MHCCTVRKERLGRGTLQVHDDDDDDNDDNNYYQLNTIITCITLCRGMSLSTVAL